jgi:hypothetical protein
MTTKIWLSAITAGIIAAGGALGVVLVGDQPTLWQLLAAVVLGLVVAAKDIRSQLQLPPVEGDGKPKPPSANHFGLWLLCGLLSFGVAGCVTEQRLAPGGAYAATETQAAQPELFVLDASFDLAYAALDATFKHEKAQRAVLWKISPNIKRGLDKIRSEATTVKGDYALARTIYLQSPTPAGLDELQTALNKLQMANVAALNVIEKKGNP